jgi:hypothetical protein
MTITTLDPEASRRDAVGARARQLVASHPVVVANTYTRWFATGAATADEVRHLTVQFSVFSHQFVEAQLRKVINAADLETYRAGKEILMNELGVIFKPAPGSGTSGAVDGGDPALVATDGSVDGSRFRFAAAHFEWLLRFASPLGLGFDQLGKRHHATASTLRFCDELLRIYGSEDASTAEGASYAVEHWAAAGFWKQLIAGLTVLQQEQYPDLNLAFWLWHDKVEDQHAAHTDDELAQAIDLPGFDEARFLAGAAEMLDGVYAFWDGLWADHLTGRTTP